jgi:hypothetical protein
MKSNRTSNYANYTGSLDENHGYRWQISSLFTK